MNYVFLKSFSVCKYKQSSCTFLQKKKSTGSIFYPKSMLYKDTVLLNSESNIFGSNIKSMIIGIIDMNKKYFAAL